MSGQEQYGSSIGDGNPGLANSAACAPNSGPLARPRNTDGQQRLDDLIQSFR